MWKKIRRHYRRLIASLLTMTMVVTNAGGNLGTIFASGETENALFLVEGRKLREAIREAEEQGEVFDFSGLHLAAERKSIKTRYEKLLGKREGAVYALNLEIDDSYAPEGTELQVFYNAGTEDVIFLFLNGSDLVVDYRVNIDGYETEPVRVNPNTANIEADGEETPAYAENYEAADMINDEAKKLGAEVLNPEETSEAAEEETGAAEEESRDDAFVEESGDAVTEETSQTEDSSQESEKNDEPAETEGSEVPEEGNAGESGDAEEETPAAEVDEREPEEESAEEAGAETEAAEETEAEEETGTEAEASEEEKSDAEDGELLSISRHEAAIVAISVDELKDGAAEVEEDAEAETEAEAEEETEAEAEEETRVETEAETEEETGVETEAETEEETEEETEAGTEAESKADENESEAADAEDKSGAGEAGTEPEESKSEAGSKPDESETGAENGENIVIEETGKDDTAQIPEEEGTSAADGADSDDSMKDGQIEMDGQMLEDDSVEILGELKGKEYDTVTVLDHVNARAWKIALEDIEAIISSEAMDYVVEYQVNIPEAAAVEGADSVAGGENLYFAVEPEEGFEIVGVYANGSEVEEVEDASDLASASDWKGYANVYVIEGVEEDLWVEVEMAELAKGIAAATYTAETEDAVFTVHAPDGAFAEEVELDVSKIEDEAYVEDLKAQANSLLKDGQTVTDVLAYDVIFLSKETGEKIEPAETVGVSARMKTAVVSEKTTERNLNITEISVVHLPDNKDAEIVASTENTEETEFEFQTESFSPILFVALTENETAKGVAKLVSGEGETYYETLQEAIDNSKEGDEILLLSDTSENIISADKSYKLNMQGNKLTCKTAGTPVFEIKGGEVVIGHGTITGGDKGSDQTGTAITGTDGARVTMEGCIITGNTGTKRVISIVGGSLTLKDSVVSDNSLTGSLSTIGILYAQNAEVSVLGNSSFAGNQIGNSSSYGNMIYVTGGSLTIDGEDDRVQISGDPAKTSGKKNIYVENAQVTIRNTDLSDISVGAEIANAAQPVSISGVRVTGDNGLTGLKLKASGEVTVKDSEFTLTDMRNSTSHSVVWLEGTGSSKVLSGCRFLNNTVADNGGNTWAPVYVKSGSAEIEDSSFTGNKGFRAGAVYKTGTGNVSLRNSFVTGNEGIGTNSSGGIYAAGNSSFTVEGCRIEENTGANAGAVYLAAGTMKATDTVITKNTSTGSANAVTGGGVVAYGGTFEMPVRTEESKNSAIYGNNSENNNANDVNIYSSAKATILPAASMKDGEMDFAGFGYVWTNLVGTDTSESLTEKSSYTRTWTAVPSKRNVARIGDVKYQSLAEAMKAVKSNETVTLIAGEDGSGSKSLPSDGMYVFGTGTNTSYSYVNADQVTIDMNGCSIYPTATAAKAISGASYSHASYGIFKVDKGVLNIKGTGELGNRILVSQGGSLNLAGDVTVKAPGGSDEAAMGLQVYGTVNVSGSVDTLSAAVYQGELNLTQDAAVNSLMLKTLPKSKSQKVVLNIGGSVENMTLNQSKGNARCYSDTANIEAKIGRLTLAQSSPNAVTNLDGEIDTLYLTHSTYVYDQNRIPPTTTAGSNFKVDTLTLRPCWGSGIDADGRPALNDMANPTRETPDIVMITGRDGHKLEESQVNWSNVGWENPSMSGTNENGNNTLIWSVSAGGDGKDYKFLTSPVLDTEKNQIVLRKTVVDGGYVFIGSAAKNITADDGNSGLKVSEPVATFGKAKEILEAHPELDTIYVSGPIEVRQEEAWELAEGKRLQRFANYSGSMVKVSRGAELTLRNITIDGGSLSNMKAEAPIIEVDGGATLNITENAILQNNGNGSVTLNAQIGKLEKGMEGGAIRNAGTLNMSGGTITGNTSAIGGGVFNCGTFNLEGGTISGNRGTGKSTTYSGSKRVESVNSGGGVCIGLGGSMNMSGGEISGNEAMIGGGISIGNSSSYYTQSRSTLEMTGGRIEGNKAVSAQTYDSNQAGGGGIFVQMGGVATISGGYITNNESWGGVDGGGGIYVNGRNGESLPNGQLYLTNVLISENEAKREGGGITVCNTGNVRIYLNDGGIIWKNTGREKNFDVFLTGPIIGSGHLYSYGNIDISRYMLGSVPYQWMNMQTGKPATSSALHSHQREELYSAADSIPNPEEAGVKVYITDNYSATRGGGIGANGDVTIGTGNTETMDITVHKKWVDSQGNELDRNTLNGVSSNLFNISYELWMKHEAADGSTKDEEPSEENGWECVDIRTATVQTNLTDWGDVTFRKLVKEDEEGRFIYKVKEVPDDRFIIIGTEENADGSWTVTNMPSNSLRISKEVKDDYGVTAGDESYSFTVTLADGGGNAVNGTFQAVRTTASEAEDGKKPEESKEEVTFTDGAASVELRDGESVHILGLSPDMTYTVWEELSGEIEYNVAFEISWAYRGRTEWENGSGVMAGSETERKPLHYGATNVKFTNEARRPEGELEIRKVVELEGRGERDTDTPWTFTLELRDKNGQALDTRGIYVTYTKTKQTEAEGEENLEEGTVTVRSSDAAADFSGSKEKYAFTLHHGEKLRIRGLTAGTKYRVTEHEANQDAYITTVNGGEITAAEGSSLICGSEGVIRHKETAESVFTNTKYMVDITGQKIWEDSDNQDNKRPGEITVNLYADNEPLEGEEYHKVVTAQEDWKWEFRDLPKYRNGKLISYTFSEDSLEETGYSVKEMAQPDEENGYQGSITNAYTPEETSRTVRKVWEDNDNQDGLRPGQVEVQLLADGADYGAAVILSEETGWSYEWTGLPRYRDQGTQIEYTVKEVETEGIQGVYNPRYSVREEDNTLVVTNTHTPATVRRAVNKVWNDENNRDNVRPASITVQLLENDAVRDTVTLSEATGWSYVWDTLPRYRDGQEIRYQVTEVKVENYNDPEYSYDESTNTFIITNTHTPNTPDRPNRPGGGGGGNPGGPSGGNTPGGPGTTTIDEPGVPLANLPPETVNELVEEEDVPLAALPRTGDSRHNRALLMMFGIAGLGMLLAAAGFRKRREEEELEKNA